VEKNVAAFKKVLAETWEELPGAIICSSKTKDGRSDILGVIEESLKTKRAD
jgi:GTP-binding protein